MVNTYLLWDGSSAPSGWVLDAGGDDYFTNKFIRGYSSFGTGGNATHTHNDSGFSCSTCTATNYVSNGNPRAATHTHTIGTIASQPANNKDAITYRTLKVIKYIGIPTSLPANIIVFFDTEPADSWGTTWDRYSSQDNYFIYCDTTAGTTHTGSHTHTVSGNIGICSASTNDGASGFVDVASATHYHTFNQQSDAQGALEPPYLTCYLGKLKSNMTSLQDGMIAMFDADPGTNWLIKSNVGGDFYQKFIKPANSYNTTGGGDCSHSHSVSAETGVPSATTKGGFEVGTSPRCGSVHTHTITLTLDAQTFTPEYRNVIFAKYTAPAVGYSDSGLRIYDGNKWIVVGKRDNPTSDDVLYVYNGSEYIRPALLPPGDSNASCIYIYTPNGYRCLAKVT